VFWYIGLIPDFATIRDRATGLRKTIYGALSFGWDGAARTWMRYESVSLILAGLATPLVLSVHTIVSFDFATSVIPGWHTTIFPPYFVAGAIFSGFAMVLTLMIVTRKVFKLEDYITISHIELMNIVIIVTGSIVGVAYITEFFIAWYSGVEPEFYAFYNRATGPYFWAYWTMMTCNVISPQLFWIKKIRTSIAATFALSIVVNIGMWFERFVIIVTSLHRDYLPSSWAMFYPTWVDVGVYLFTFGLFFTLFLLFAKFFPVINMAEVKAVLKSSSEKVSK
jgi:molybdopterin-containing oxidoreductase family membrane subunit